MDIIIGDQWGCYESQGDKGSVFISYNHGIHSDIGSLPLDQYPQGQILETVGEFYANE